MGKFGEIWGIDLMKRKERRDRKERKGEEESFLFLPLRSPRSLRRI
jgi:hypothetical protein